MAPPLIAVAQSDLNGLALRLKALEQAAPLAMARALNRARISVTARLVRWLVAATGIPSARLRRSLRTRAATRSHLEAAIALYAGRAPLIQYNRAIQRSALPGGGFRQRMPGSGHVGYFERAPGARHRRKGEPFAPHALPIREVYGPAFTSFIGDVGLADLLRFAGERLRIELEREITFRETQKAA